MSRISDAFAVLTGSKLAAPPELFSLVAEAATALLRAQRQNPTMSKTELSNLKSDADEAAEHGQAVARMRAITAYLVSLPALFVVILKQLDDLRANVRMYDEERLAFNDVKNQLQARADELENLIGGAADAVAVADTADNPLAVKPEDQATPETPGGTEAPPIDAPTEGGPLGSSEGSAPTDSPAQAAFKTANPDGDWNSLTEVEQARWQAHVDGTKPDAATDSSPPADQANGSE